MYTKQIPFKDYHGKPRNGSVNFQLEPQDVVKNLEELQAIVAWYEAAQANPDRDIPTERVIDFYNTFEKVLLEAWGEPSEDGLYFRRTGRYDFEESKLFSATMVHFLTDPSEIAKFLEEVMPADMAEMVSKASANTQKLVNSETDPEKRAELEKLQARIEEIKSSTNS